MLSVVSLFSGAGGLDLGVAEAGGRTCAAVEPDPDAASTLRANGLVEAHQVTQRPVQELTSGDLVRRGDRPGLLIGGPPCQPFSKARYWSARTGQVDERIACLREYVRVLRGLRPEGFIFENVGSLLHPASKPVLDAFMHEVARSGYATTMALLNAVEYGVPQRRLRLFVVGLRGRVAPALPPPTRAWSKATRGMPQPEAVGPWIAPFASRRFEEVGEGPGRRWATELRAVPPGRNYKVLTKWAGHPSPRFEAERRFWSFLLKLDPRLPSWTIAANPGPWTGPFHWSSRRLRMSELAAIQTFPSDYFFAGSRTSVRRQIGNAVPPLLAYQVAAPLIAQIMDRPTRLPERLSDAFVGREPKAHASGAGHW